MTRIAVLLIAKLRSVTMLRIWPIPAPTRKMEFAMISASEYSGENEDGSSDFHTTTLTSASVYVSNRLFMEGYAQTKGGHVQAK